MFGIALKKITILDVQAAFIDHFKSIIVNMVVFH